MTASIDRWWDRSEPDGKFQPVIPANLWFNASPPHLDPADVDAVRRVAAGHARDAGDLRDLLWVLGVL